MQRAVSSETLPSVVVCLRLDAEPLVEAGQDLLGAVDVAGGAGAHDAGVLALRLEGEEGVEGRDAVDARVRDARACRRRSGGRRSSRKPNASWAACSASISAAGRSPMRRIRVSTIFQRLSSLGGGWLGVQSGHPHPPLRWPNGALGARRAIADLGRRSARAVPAILRARRVRSGAVRPESRGCAGVARGPPGPGSRDHWPGWSMSRRLSPWPSSVKSPGDVLTRGGFIRAVQAQRWPRKRTDRHPAPRRQRWLDPVASRQATW